ncbi:hypothetical protein [Streptomyces sp. NPDC127084]|uniref:hypothetical protein n=1 Tax=Streptomyces sp. NPDC127084 TaxID=3347133 RepID=UPI00365AF4CB
MGMATGIRSHRTAVGLVIAALVWGVGGCSDSDTDIDAGAAEPSAPSAPPKSNPAVSHAHDSDGETVTEAPAPFSGKAVVRVAARTGNAVLPLKPVGTGKLGIHVNCQGKGSLTVSVPPLGLSFGLACGDKVTGESTEFHTHREKAEEGSIQITAPTTVRWALTVEQ